jgi:hypothetical protein
MYVCMYVCMYVYKNVIEAKKRDDDILSAHTGVCMYVCMYVCIYACIHTKM